MRPLHVVGFAVLALTSGCYRMTIVSGRAPTSDPVAGYDDKWRSATVLDAVEIDKPLPLDLVCKETGWATIDQKMTAVNWLVDVFLAGFVYESNAVSLRCAGGKPRSSPPAPKPTAPEPTSPAESPPVPL
jgi:hypothetical protein